MFLIALNRMAPAQQNVVDVCEAGEAQIKIRLLDNCYKDSSGLKVIENNNVIREDPSEKTNSDNFDISVYESVEFRPRIKWPDLLVQLSLHLVSVYGLFLMLTNSVRFYTTIFGKSVTF